MNNYNHLDLDKVKDLVCQYTSIKQASYYIQNEDIIFNPLVIKSKLKDSEEALNLLKMKYKGLVDFIYIDPPYNTVHSKILYKNQFEHSSWLCLLNNTMPLSRYFLKNDFSKIN